MIALALVGFATGAAAQEGGRIDPPRGLWETEPDGIGVVFHVRTRGCGSALCARVERVKNRAGLDAPSDAVGERLLSRLRPQPDGSFLGEYRDGYGAVFPQSRATVVGREMRLRACEGGQCKDVLWRRIR
ncbi:Imidazoleglycerol-phosphate dehydratase [Sulfitobacter noctilucae]|nr:Imidazoleglycerol-phosphate dehydratase [Sulfitobacter noctilucae]